MSPEERAASLERAAGLAVMLHRAAVAIGIARGCSLQEVVAAMTCASQMAFVLARESGGFPADGDFLAFAASFQPPADPASARLAAMPAEGRA